ncbi:MAG: class I tRNA ligase family protein, partial [Elusimicrobia bacterium]|nr:class I tRNA ligase family protein [Elusimicrobiota bacterium]
MENKLKPSTYTPGFEEEIYKFWIEKKFFARKIDKRKPFVIVIPPPNITGSLHMGHALNNVLQDIFIRYNLLNGKNARWIPGTDHGGIATQTVVEKE